MIHSFLRNNAEYRLKFADHVQKHFGPGGPLYVDTNSSGGGSGSSAAQSARGALPEADWRGGSGECAGIRPLGGQCAGPDEQSVYAGGLSDGAELDDEHLLPATIE